MTIEIRQLIIRATVNARPAGSPAGTPEPSRPAAVAPERGRAAPSAPAVPDEVLVAACVREVLREIRRSKER